MDRTSNDPTSQPAATPGVAETSAAFEGAHSVLRARPRAAHEIDWDAIAADTRRRFPKTLARLAQ